MRLGPQRDPDPRLANQPRRQARPKRSSGCAAPGRRAWRGPTSPAGRHSRRSRFSACGEARRLGIRSDIRQRIDARAARQRIGRAVHVEREEQAGAEPAGDCRALLERQIAVAVAGQRDPHPAALREPVAKLAGESQGQLLFRHRPGHRDAPGSRPPWPGSITTIGRPGALALVTWTSTAGAIGTVTPPRRASPISAGRACSLGAASLRRRQAQAAMRARRPRQARRQLPSAVCRTVEPCPQIKLLTHALYHADMVNDQLAYFNRRSAAARCCDGTLRVLTRAVGG